MGGKYLLLILVLILVTPLVTATPLDMGACTIQDECTQQTEIECINQSFSMVCNGVMFLPICFPFLLPYTFDEGEECPDIPIIPADHTTGTCILDDGSCVDSSMGQGNITNATCALIGSYSTNQIIFNPGAMCRDYAGACFVELPDIIPPFGEPISGEELCVQTGGVWTNGVCCLDHAYDQYMNEIMCNSFPVQSGLASEWMGLGTTCADDFTDNEVPEFGTFGSLAIISILGLYIWRRKR